MILTGHMNSFFFEKRERCSEYNSNRFFQLKDKS